jgi:hypothetical protein
VQFSAFIPVWNDTVWLLKATESVPAKDNLPMAPGGAVRSTAPGARGVGANGIVLFRATGPIQVTDNELWSNVNPSPEPGADPGGAFEVYAWTDVQILRNRIWDSSVLETGTEDGLPCGRPSTRHCRWQGSAKMWWMVSRILASPSVGLLVAEPETGLA